MFYVNLRGVPIQAYKRTPGNLNINARPTHGYNNNDDDPRRIDTSLGSNILNKEKYNEFT